MLLSKLAFLALFLLPLAAPAQEATELELQLAAALCDCFSAGRDQLVEVVPACLRSVLLPERRRLRATYGLDVSQQDERHQLVERLADPLLDGCPLLATLEPARYEREQRWSDLRQPPPEEPLLPYRAAKGVRPAAPVTLAEVPDAWTRAGRLLSRPGSKGFRLRSADGKEHYFEALTAATRKRDFRVGEAVTVTYRREWRIAEGRIVAVAVRIE